MLDISSCDEEIRRWFASIRPKEGVCSSGVACRLRPLSRQSSVGSCACRTALVCKSCAPCVFVKFVEMPPSLCGTLRVWLLSALVVHGAVAGNPDAKRLYDDLLSNYNKLVRPVVNTSDVLRVCIKLKLSQLIDVVRYITLPTFIV